MDDWNDFGPEPTSFGTASSTSFASFRSSQAAEPRSVLLPGRRNPPPRPPSSAPPIHYSTPELPEPSTSAATSLRIAAPSEITEDVSLGAEGDLDAATDCEDIGLSYRTFNSSERYHSVSLTKLEVISAQQIQQILHAFHVLIAIAVCWALFSVIIVNTLMSRSYPVQINEALLSQAQKDWAAEQEKLSREQQFAVRMRIPTPLIRSTTTHASHATAELHKPPIHWYTMREIRKCELRRNGFEYVLRTLYSCVPDLNDKTDPCYTYWHSGLSLDQLHNFPKRSSSLSTTGRQSNIPGLPVAGQPRTNRIFWTMRVVDPKRWFVLTFYFIDILSGIVIFVVSVLFVIRLVRAGRANLSQEQILAGGMLFSIIPLFNVPNISVAMHFLIVDGTPVKWFDELDEPFEMLSYAALSPLLLFFVWATFHSYRILDPAQKLGFNFYLPKLIVLLVYVSFKIGLYFGIDIQPAEMPIMTALIMQNSFAFFNGMRVYRREIIATLVYTAVEIVVLGIVVWQGFVTASFLRKVPYMKHRSKHTGFRFFAYMTLMFFLSFFLLQAFLLLTRPVGNFYVAQFAFPEKMGLYIEPNYMIGNRILLLGYVIIWAFVNLPHNSVGAVKGWFKASELVPLSMRWSVTSSTDSSTSESDNVSASESMSGAGSSSGRHLGFRDVHTPRFIVDKDHELNQEIIGPVTYRKREFKRLSDSEDASSQSLELKANCFTMQTHVIMFNFAWYVYYYGTPKFERLSQQEQQLSFNFSIFESIRDEGTDTQAIVIDGSDRIIVTFKGSTSLRNLRTSLAVYQERLLSVVPSNLNDGRHNELERLQQIFGRYYEAAKIHKGFANAYSSVSERIMKAIQALHDKNPRPIFLTGHSLGGALATICSLDVWVKLRISRRQIFVSTFGSPRVGNEAFKRIYDSVIALHWRIVVDPDMIAKLPSGFYRHVGKKVLLTQHGEMFIDPNALELKLWSGSTSGLAYHRKASYLLAMRAWCLRHHRKSYTPAFWSFPLRREDYARFEGANAGIDDDLRSLAANKLVMRDTMVDALDHGTIDAHAVELWARLARRLLLRHKLETAVAR